MIQPRAATQVPSAAGSYPGVKSDFVVYRVELVGGVASQARVAGVHSSLRGGESDTRGGWRERRRPAVAIAEMIRRYDRVTVRQRRCATGYFLACSKYGLVPEAWSVTSTTWMISGTAWVIATSMPWLRVTVAMPQP